VGLSVISAHAKAIGHDAPILLLDDLIVWRATESSDIGPQSRRQPMTRLRFTLAQLVAVVLFIGFGFAALHNADEFWASATYTLAITLIAASLVGAIVRRSEARATWAGFAVFGWTYLLVVRLPPCDTGGLGFGPIPTPNLLIEWAIGRLQPYIYPTLGGRDLTPYEQVSHSVGIILFGLLGAVVGRLFVTKDEPPHA
jgi:hypothetical protein